LLIRFKTKPASAPWIGAAPTRIHRGREILVRGSTLPVANDQVVRLLVARPGAQKARSGMKTLAKVRTNRRGRFFYKGWTPKRLGTYAVAVTYKSQRRTLASDFACSRFFKLVK
jgi:hypothetical protein